VGILATNCIEWVEALFAIYKIRASAVNINFRYVEEELRYSFENSDIVACIYHASTGPSSPRRDRPSPPAAFRPDRSGTISTADDAALDRSSSRRR